MSGGVVLLLPPSEAKAPRGRGRALRAGLAIAAAEGDPLARTRLGVMSEVAKLCAADPSAASAALALPPAAVGAACAANVAALDAPTLRALDRYTGVLWAALDVASMTPATRRLAERSVLGFSGGFGVVKGGEAVPDYRVPASGRLPDVGLLTAAWRPVLAELMPGLIGARLVVDLRSSDYAAMWTPARAEVDRVVAVRVLHGSAGGAAAPKVISYNSKHAKGRLARLLLDTAACGTAVTTPDDVAAVGERLGWTPSVQRTARGTTLDFIAPYEPPQRR